MSSLGQDDEVSARSSLIFAKTCALPADPTPHTPRQPLALS